MLILCDRIPTDAAEQRYLGTRSIKVARESARTKIRFYNLYSVRLICLLSNESVSQLSRSCRKIGRLRGCIHSVISAQFAAYAH